MSFPNMAFYNKTKTPTNHYITLQLLKQDDLAEGRRYCYACCNFVAVYLKAGLIYALNHNMKLSWDHGSGHTHG